MSSSRLEQTSPSPDEASTSERLRATALRHAYNIEDKKRLQARIADLVVAAFDLPRVPITDPSDADSADVVTFKQCLKLFQPSDFDDLAYERNIDDRCGYALCSNANIKLSGGEKAWNGRVGSEFKIVPKAELERWCSRRCEQRAQFVRSQLAQEPAWIRETVVLDVKLLDEMQPHPKMAEDVTGSLSTTKDVTNSQEDLKLEDVEEPSSKDDISTRLQALALERGELQVHNVDRDVSILERQQVAHPQAPRVADDGVSLIEGHHPRRVRFAHDMAEEDDDDESM